jgi:hypothetical protein
MLRNCLSLRLDSNFHGSLFVSRMPAEAENHDVKDTGDEIAPVTPGSERELVHADGRHSEAGSSTQDEMDVHISDSEGQLVQAIISVGITNL